MSDGPARPAARIGAAAFPFGKLGRFVTVGATSTALYAAFGLLFAHGLGFSPLSATLAAYLLASAFSYVAHRRVTFRSDRAHRAAAPRFALTTLCGLALAALLTIGVERFGLPYFVAVAGTCVLVPIFNFVVLDHLVFGPGASERGAP